MRPDNVKFLFQSFIECKLNQDEIDSPGNLGVEFDNPSRPNPYSDAVTFVPYTGEDASSDLVPSFHSTLLGSTAALPFDVITAGRNLAQMAEKFSTAEPEKSIVKFKEICMVTAPIQQTISIPVLRDQAFSQIITKVSWKTCDKTALSNIHYVECNGEIVFNQGETSKDIEVQILNSVDDSSVNDLRFTVELSCGIYSPRPITVSLKKINNLEPPELMVLRNLPSSLPFTISDVKYALDGCLNARTLHMALTHLCSTSNVVDVQIALALQLCFTCLQKSSGSSMPLDSILKVLSDFLRKDAYGRWK